MGKREGSKDLERKGEWNESCGEKGMRKGEDNGVKKTIEDNRVALNLHHLMLTLFSSLVA